MPKWLYHLTLVHRKLDSEIDREIRRPRPDAFRLLRLKKLRLAVKDRMAARMRPQTA